MSTTSLKNPFRVIAQAVALIAVVVLTAGSSIATEASSNAFCPVTPNEPVDLAISTEYEGQQIYFCCQRCKRQFEASPAKYLNNLVLNSPDSATHDLEHEPDTNSHGHSDSHSPSPELAENTQHANSPHGGHQHDHATGHTFEDEAGFGDKLLSWLGKFHPAIIHFPIALMIAGAVAECLYLIWNKDWLTASVRFVVIFAAVSAVPAAALGWLNAAYGSQPEELAQTLFLHRWIGTTAAVLAVVTAALSERSRCGGSKLAFRVVLLTTAALIGLTGHLGGTLIYGEGYLAW